ncbi:amidase [Exophiala aquamarina CBS 119918]|uniref:Amidase n=1 Tax=Exophiala aquamarina CBS 119918 TaxID=1182545 RepID=A0A072P8P2_9EURO|nr:amidase [Exophiala aquamarina CBS 119918]KEF55648.1 amidase [Exophiala aquamarina CBS 119918]
MPTSKKTLSVVEATVSDLTSALAGGHITSVELITKSLLRIAKYDRRSILLNSTPIINERVFEEAQASDDRRASHLPIGPLDGIPCTIKDSYKIKGMTVAAGSPAFQNLVANEDAFTVAKIRGAGAVILGRTNMPPMAAGGMQRGVYGRAESPYNSEYLTAAFASGSSNGSATATAASFGVFGMGEETISSGRSPASNNGLVAYTPSRGIISLRGNWPLFPTCDVVVPHTRTVADMFCLLDAIAVEDRDTNGDFWRGQPFIKLPEVEKFRPKSYHDLADAEALTGKKIGVPKMYIGEVDSDPRARKVHTRQSVIDLWMSARKKLESLGATVEEVDFPVVTNFDATDGHGTTDESSAPPHRNEVDMAQLMAYAWDDFLAANGDAGVATSLAQIDSSTIFPRPPGALPDRYDAQDPLVRHTDVVAHVTNGRVPTYDIQGLANALHKLEAVRKSEYEDWLTSLGLDAVVWPCNADVGRADADTNEESAKAAWRNGVLYSNGNCAIRQLGIPTVNVPMGVMADTGMPVNLTFAGRAYDDAALFKYAFAFEEATRLRQPPGRTPVLVTDTIALLGGEKKLGISPPTLTLSEAEAEAEAVVVDQGGQGSQGGKKKIHLAGTVSEEELSALHLYVDGNEISRATIVISKGEWRAHVEVDMDLDWFKVRPEEKRVPDLSKSMVIVLAKGKNGRSSAKMEFV